METGHKQITAGSKSDEDLDVPLLQVPALLNFNTEKVKKKRRLCEGTPMSFTGQTVVKLPDFQPEQALMQRKVKSAWEIQSLI